MFSLNIEKLVPESFFSKLLHSKTAVWICILLAWLNKTLIAWLYTDLEGDKSLYLLFSKSFLEKRSLLEPVSLAETGQTVFVYDPAITSPMYSLLAAPLLWITNSYTSTSFIIDMMAWSIFFTGLYKVAMSLYQERWIANLLVLCAGLFLFPHEMDSGPKDTLSIGFLIWSVYFTYRIIKGTGNITLNSLLLLLCLCAMGFTKYLYSPLILLIGLTLILYSLLLKNRMILYHSLSVLTVCFFITLIYSKVGLLALQNNATLSWEDFPSWDSKTFTRGWYPENLKATFPFISSALINTNFWGVQLSKMFQTSFITIQRCFQNADLILLTCLFWLLKKRTQDLSRTVFFLLFSVSFFIIALLLYMSLRHAGVYYKAGGNTGPGWTYVSDARSFLFPMLSLQLLFFFLLFKTTLLHPILRNFLFLLFFIECIHGVYFTTKQMLHADMVHTYDSTASPVKRVTKGLLNLKKDYKDIALITSDSHLRRYALLNDIPTFTFSNQPCIKDALPLNTLYVVATLESDSAYIQKCFAPNLLQPTDAVPPFYLHFYKPKW
jgi:hypothetical protein